MQKRKTLSILMYTLVIAPMMAIGCSDDHDSISSPVRFFPVVKESLQVEIQKEIEGTLVLDNGYLKINYETIDSLLLLIWPYGYSSRVEDEDIQVIDNNGQVTARVGEQIIVGGHMAYGLLDEYTAQPLPSDCAELRMCWLVSGVLDDYSEPSDTAPEWLEKPQGDDGLVIGAELYAQHIGVTVEEALRRSEIKDTLRGLGTKLKNNEPETFAGLYIQHTPEYRFVALFTHDGEETIKPYIPEGMDEYVEVRTAEFSYAELQDARHEVKSFFDSLGIKSGSCTNIMENRVEFDVLAADRIMIDNAIRDGKLRVPDGVDIITVESLAQFAD